MSLQDRTLTHIPIPRDEKPSEISEGVYFRP